MDEERALITKIIYSGRGLDFLDGLTDEHFNHKECFEVVDFLRQGMAKYGKQPTVKRVRDQFPDFTFEPSEEETLESLRDGFLKQMAYREAVEYVRGMARLAREKKQADKFFPQARKKLDEIERLFGAIGQTHGSIVWGKDVQATRVLWFWKPYVVLGGLSLFVGDPGIGKGLAGAWITQRATRGLLADEKMRVGILGVEDPRGLQKSRLVAVGADEDYYGFIAHQDGRPYTFPTDANALERHILEHNLRAVIIDPVENHLDAGVSTHNSKELRDALTPLMVIAEKTNCAVLVVLHLNKDEAKRLLYRGMGSIAWAGTARSMIALGKKHEDEADSPDRYLFAGKSNYARMPGQSLRFRVLETQVEIDDGEPPESVAYLEMVGPSDVTMDEVFGAPPPRGRGRPKDEEMRAWLEDQFSGRVRVPVEEIKVDAADAGYSFRTLKEIKHEVGIVHKRVGAEHVWEKRSPFLKKKPSAGGEVIQFPTLLGEE